VCELPCPHRAGSNVPNLARLDEVVKRLHRLLRRHIVQIGAVNLEEVDVRRVQPLKRGLDLVEDRRARETTLVDVVALLPQVRTNEGKIGDIIGDDAQALREESDTVARNVVLRATA
jgi:hypothetical protein